LFLLDVRSQIQSVFDQMKLAAKRSAELDATLVDDNRRRSTTPLQRDRTRCVTATRDESTSTGQPARAGAVRQLASACGLVAAPRP
jgi:hypothetical protein